MTHTQRPLDEFECTFINSVESWRLCGICSFSSALVCLCSSSPQQLLEIGKSWLAWWQSAVPAGLAWHCPVNPLLHPPLQLCLKPHPATMTHILIDILIHLPFPTPRHYFIPRPLFCERQVRFVNLKLKLSSWPKQFKPTEIMLKHFILI